MNTTKSKAYKVQKYDFEKNELLNAYFEKKVM